MKRLRLFLLIAPLAFAQAVEPGSDPVLTPEVLEAMNELGPGPTDVGYTIGKPVSGAGLCEINIIVSNRTGQTRTVKTRSYAVDCDELNVDIRYSPLYIKITLKPKQQPPGGPSPFDSTTSQNIQDFLNWLNGGTGRAELRRVAAVGYTAVDAAASRTAASVPEVLDMPFAPPFSQGSDLESLNGCDPAAPPVIFRVNHYNDTVTRLDGCAPTSAVTIPVGSAPLQGALTPDGKTLIVTSFENVITFIDTATNRVTRSLATPPDFYPAGIAVTRDGLLGYVTSFDDIRPALAILDIPGQRILTRITLPYEYPNGVFITPDGTQAYITHPFGTEVIVFDLLTSSVASVLPVFEPRAVAFNRTGTRAFISGGRVVRIFDTSTMQQVDAIEVGVEPANLELSLDGHFLFIEDYATTRLYVLQLTTRVLKSVDTGVQSPGFTLN